MQTFKSFIRVKAIAWILSICLIITLIPDIGYATEAVNTSEATVTEEVESDAGEQIHDGNDPMTELDPETANDPAMAGLTEDNVVEKTESTTTFESGNGMKTIVLHGGEVRFENEEGELIDYDPALIEIADSETTVQDVSLDGYEYRNNEGDKMQYLPEHLSEDTPVIMEYSGHQITITPTDDTVRALGLISQTAKLQDDVVPSIYDGEGKLMPVNAVYGDETNAGTVTYTSGDAGIKETLTFNEKPASNVFTYELSAGDLIVKENVLDEGITIIDPETDDIVAGIDAPWMNDATGEAYSTDITYELEKVAYEEGVYILTMTVDEDYLSSEDRVYPVTIDPTVTWRGNDMIRDTYVVYGSGYAGTNFYETANTKMPVGTNSTGRHRSLFKILNLKAQVEGMSIASATLTLYESGTGTSGQLVRANRITQDWTPSTVTWNNQPTWNTEAYTAQVTTSGTKNTAKNFDCTAFVRNVANGTSNYGLILRNMNDNPNYACFWGSRYATTSYRPKLIVEFYSIPTKATSASMEIKSGAAGTKEGKHVYVKNSTDTTINYSGITSTGLKRVEHRIWTYLHETDSIGEMVVDYGAESAIASGGTTPSLREECYRVNIRGVNQAEAAGDYKSAGTIHVDKTVPAFSSAAISPVTSASSKTSNPAPTLSWNVSDKHFKNLSVSLDGQEIYSTAAEGEGQYTLPDSYIKQAGEYTLLIKATDKSGNTSTRSFTYHVGAVGTVVSAIATVPQTTGAVPSNKQDPTVNWTIGGSDISTLELKVNGTKVNDPSITTASRSYRLGSSVLSSSGEYEVEVVITDSKGRESSQKINYNLDISAPVISEVKTIPETGVLNQSNNRSPLIRWKLSDPDIASLSYSMDRNTWITISNMQSGEIIFPSSAWLSDTGQQTIYLRAIDNTGNIGPVRELKYYLGNGGSYAPQNMSVREYYGKKVLSWELDAYDQKNIVYDIHRGTSAGFTPSSSNLIESGVCGGNLHYVDNDILDSGTYYYCIVVRDTTGNMSSIASNKVSVSNTFTSASLKNFTGNKDYLSYTAVGLPTGTLQVEESSGNLMYEQDDFSVSNPQLDYGMSRTYNSQLSLTSMIGKGWMDSYHKELFGSGNYIYLLESDGGIYKYALSSGVYTCNEYPGSKVSKDAEGYTLTTKDDVTYTFNKSGQLVETSELNGCSIKNVYDSEGHLASVISYANEAAAKTLDFVYVTDSDFLDSVTDHVGTKYSYSYTGTALQNLTVSSGSNEVFYGYVYDSTGRLKTVNDGERNSYSITYSSGKAASVSYPDGEKTTFSYGSGRTDMTRKTPEGDTIYTEYTTFDTSNGKILSHSDPAGRVTSYTYKTDNPYLIATESSPRGFETVNSNSEIQVESDTAISTINSYNSDGEVTSETTEEGTNITYTYSNGNLTHEVAVNNGTTITDTTYVYDPVTDNLKQMTDSVENIVETYQYNGDGQERNVIVKDAGIKVSETVTGYDSAGNADSETNISGTIETGSYTEYDSMGRAVEVKDGNVTTVNVYDYLGRLIRETVSEPGKTDIVKTYSYDMNGSLLSETDSSGVSKTYGYDDRNRVIRETTSGSGMDSRTVTTAYGFDKNVKIEDGRGGRTEAVVYTETESSSSGKTTIRNIDKAGNVVKEVAGSSFTDYTYDKSDNQVVSYRGSTAGTDHEITVQAYDIYGNVIAEISNPSVSSQKYIANDNSVAVFRTYDIKGNLLNERNKYAASAATDTISYTYDNKGRILTANVGNDTAVDLQVSYTGFKSNIISTITDLNGNKKLQVTDESGNTVSTRDVAGSSGNNIYVGSKYDKLGRLIRVEYSDGGHIEYTYEGDSGRISVQKAYMGNTLESQYEYLYTGYGALQKVTCKNGTGTVYSTEEYTYDAEGKVLTEKVTYQGQSSQTTAYNYDSDGNLESVTYPSVSSLGKVSYIYDTKGRVTKVSNTNGVIREYGYDNLDRVSHIKDHDSPGASSYIYKAFSYDPHGRITSMTYRDNGSSGTVLESFAYTYKAGSNDIASAVHINNMLSADKKINETRAYVYDDHGNLTQSTKTDHLSGDAKTVTKYTYDPVGNRLSETVGSSVTNYTYNGLNQLTSMSVNGTKAAEYSYDERGNLIQEDDLLEDISKTVKYAVTGEMVSLIKKNDTAELLKQENKYNHNGQRISRKQNGTTRSYYYDRGVAAFTLDGTSLSAANVLDAEADAVGTYRGSTYYTYLKDGQASTTSLVKQDGSLAAAYDYTDFGETTEITGSSVDNQICYTGGIYDKETGLYYLNARYYDPEIGRFISQDSYRGELDDPGQWHLYAYCANNPINYVDPSGHKYSVSMAVKYALKWAHYRNMQYKTHRYDCTNFVSQCLNAGGLSQNCVQNVDNKPDMWVTTKYWYSKKYKKRFKGNLQNAWKESSSWVNVKDFYNYWKSRSVSLNECKSQKALQNSAKKGDIVQFYSNSSGWHHSVIITGGKKGKWKYSAHSRNRKNHPVSGIGDNEKKFRIIRPKI